MRITPLDIRKQEFRKTMRGLDSEEVYAFLSTVADEYEAVLSDNKNLRERIVELEERLKEYKNIEQNLRNTLLTAEKVTSEAKENARREACLIVREAEVEAEKAAETIRAHTQQLRREILELKKQKDNYLLRLKTLIESHRKVLEGFEEDFAGVDREIERIGKKVEEDVSKAVPNARMSREKITEEYAHGPKDKVTWDEERRREDEPRPSVPRETWENRGEPGRRAVPNDEAAGRAPEEGATAAPRPGQDKGERAPGMRPSPRAPQEPAGRAPEEPASRAPDSERDMKKIRSEVAGIRKGKPYPRGGTGAAGEDEKAGTGARVGEAGMETPDRPETAEHTAAQVEVECAGDGAAVEGSAEEEFPEAAAAEQAEPPQEKDRWKEYDVRGTKPDWTDYELSGGRRPAAKTEGAIEDREVEEALSGLEEVAGGGSGGEPERKAPPPAAAPPSNGSPAVEERRAERASEGVGEGTPVNRDAPETAGGDKDTWSMDELRRNLTNLSRDDEDQG